MTREIYKFETSKGNVLEIKTYLTGLEDRTIQSVYLKIAQVSFKGDGTPSFDKVDMSVQFEVEKELIKHGIASVNGSVENILDTILNFPSTEYNEVIKELNKLTEKKN